MKHPTHSYFLLFLAFFWSFRSWPLSFREALERAEVSNPEISETKKTWESAKLESEVAFNAFLPSLDLNTTHGRAGDLPKQKNTPRYLSEFHLDFTETLFDNGESYLKHKKSKINLAHQELEYKIGQNKLAYNIAEALLKFYTSQKSLESQKAQHELIKKQYNLIEKDYLHGLKSRRDYLRLKTQSTRSLLDLEEAQNQLKKNEIDLRKILGEDSSDIETEGDKISASEISLDLSSFDKILSSSEKDKSFDLLQEKSQNLQREMLKVDTQLVERNLWPELQAKASANYQSSNYWGSSSSFKDNDNTSWTALLNIKYNIFDWGTRSKQRALARNRESIENFKLASLDKDLKAEFRKTLQDIDMIQKNIAIAKELRDLEKKNLSDIETEYRNGKALYLDLISGLQDYSQADNRYLRLDIDLKLKRLFLLAQQGKLYELVKQN